MDFSAKRSLIEAIDDEVKVLHPLLEHTLRHLEGVSNVNYTHGPSERGADFILTRTDQSLGVVGYIGVIVKIGKILNNFDDIERQVDECRLPRTLPGGTVAVRLSEVWVITNSSISRNAQDKIQEKYAAQKLIFINGERLTELVDRFASYFWYNVPSEVGSYLQDLSKQLNALDSEMNVLQGLDCSDFYVEPEIQEFSRSKYSKSNRVTRPKIVNLVDTVTKNKVTVLEGDMGFGKSKTVRHVARYYCAPERYKAKPVLPIFTTFRHLVDNESTLAEYLTKKLPEHLTPESGHGATYLLVVDGVDEVIGKVADWNERLQRLIKEANSRDDVRLLLTSRPLKLLDEQAALFAGSHRYTLQPLSLKKLISFIERACQSLSLPKRLFEDLQRSELFKQLPHSPIAAALLSRLLAQNSSDLPSNLTELYSKSTENMLGRWDIARGGCTEKEYKDADRVILDLADYIVGNRLGYISLGEAKQRISDWHSRRNTSTPLVDLEERVLEKSGLLLCDEESGIVAFRHRSFGEFLYARSRQVRNAPLLPAESFSPESVYVQFFYTGLLGDCEDHLRSLMSYTPTSETEAWLKILLLPDYMLAGYQTPYALTEKNLYKIFIEAAILFGKIRQGNTKTKLSELPIMHLLWFFQRIVRSAFQYEFFRKAIPATLVNIDQELLDSETKQYALFFASCFAAQLEDGTGFEYLLKTYDTSRLLLPIALAIRIERDMNKDFAKLPLLKQHERRLNELLLPMRRSNAAEDISRRQSIDDLFEKPVKSTTSARTTGTK